MSATEVEVTQLPSCDFGDGRVAYADAKTRQGPWAYLCKECFDEFAVGLGLGKGQRLVLRRTRLVEPIDWSEGS